MQGLEKLTDRERRVFNYMLKGFSIRDIAIKYFCSMREIEECKESIIGKLDHKLMDELLEKYSS